MIRIQNETETQCRNENKNDVKIEERSKKKKQKLKKFLSNYYSLLIFLGLDQKNEPTIISNSE